MTETPPHAAKPIDERTGASFDVQHLPTGNGVVTGDCPHGCMQIQVSFPPRLRSADAHALLADLGQALVRQAHFRLLMPVAGTGAMVEKLPVPTRLREPDVGGFTYRDDPHARREGAIGYLYVAAERHFPELTKGDIERTIERFVAGRNHGSASMLGTA